MRHQPFENVFLAAQMHHEIMKRTFTPGVIIAALAFSAAAQDWSA